MTLKPIALTAALLLVAAPLTAQTDVTPPSAEEMQAAMTTPQAFAERAASSNLFEIESSQLALERARSEEVRAFAEKMIAEHTAAGEQMRAAATEEGLTPVETLMPDHLAQLNNLTTSDPADFDAAYVGAQLAAHTEAVQLFQGYSTQGPGGALRTFATETLPKLEEHLTEVEPLAEV
jgi:putative membrane protein